MDEVSTAIEGERIPRLWLSIILSAQAQGYFGRSSYKQHPRVYMRGYRQKSKKQNSLDKNHRETALIYRNDPTPARNRACRRFDGGPVGGVCRDV